MPVLNVDERDVEMGEHIVQPRRSGIDLQGLERHGMIPHGELELVRSQGAVAWLPGMRRESPVLPPRTFQDA